MLTTKLFRLLVCEGGDNSDDYDTEVFMIFGAYVAIIAKAPPLWLLAELNYSQKLLPFPMAAVFSDFRHILIYPPVFVFSGLGLYLRM